MDLQFSINKGERELDYMISKVPQTLMYERPASPHFSNLLLHFLLPQFWYLSASNSTAFSHFKCLTSLSFSSRDPALIERSGSVSALALDYRETNRKRWDPQDMGSKSTNTSPDLHQPSCWVREMYQSYLHFQCLTHTRCIIWMNKLILILSLSCVYPHTAVQPLILLALIWK